MRLNVTVPVSSYCLNIRANAATEGLWIGTNDETRVNAERNPAPLDVVPPQHTMLALVNAVAAELQEDSFLDLTLLFQAKLSPLNARVKRRVHNEDHKSQT